MKRLILVILFFIGYASISFAQNCNSLEKAQQEAIENNKQVLLYFSGSDWCKPCILLKEKILNNKVFKDKTNDKFVIVNYDFPQNQKGITKAEIRCREEVAEQFNPQGVFPMLVLLDSNRVVVNAIEGYLNQSVEVILEELETIE